MNLFIFTLFKNNNYVIQEKKNYRMKYGKITNLTPMNNIELKTIARTLTPPSEYINL